MASVKRQPPGIHQARLTPVGERHLSSLGHRRECHGGRLLTGNGGQTVAPDVADFEGAPFGPVPDRASEFSQSPYDGVATPLPFQLYSRRGQAQSRQLRFVEAWVGQLVQLARDPIADLVGVAFLAALRDEGEAHLAKELLVTLEVPPERLIFTGVAVDALADLASGQGMRGVDQGGHQVDQTFQSVHGYSEAMSFSTRSSRNLKGSLQSTVRCA